MLEQLRITNLGVIDDVDLALGPGLTVLTGETGAGKTMVVTALSLLFGGRADSARVRTGSHQAAVDGRLRVPARGAVADRVAEAGGALDDDTGGDVADDGCGLVLRRTVTAAGRSRAFVGGASAPVTVLAELADSLFVVHGQSDQIRLVRQGAQRAALDRFAAVDPAAYSAAYDSWRLAEARLAERSGRTRELRLEADVLEHGLAEIRAAEPQPGEDVELAATARRLAHVDALRLAAAAAHDAILGDDDQGAAGADVLTLLAEARRALTQVAGADDEVDKLADRLAELATLAADLGADLAAYRDGL
ncbi:MAG: AAA family ATPase, partial [Actinobacteria bacterium]|nr:AAA family ATPase [Actinomycetota bacterium]